MSTKHMVYGSPSLALLVKILTPTSCSQYGFCGTTEDFCGDECQSNCVLHPSPSGAKGSGVLSKGKPHRTAMTADTVAALSERASDAFPAELYCHLHGLTLTQRSDWLLRILECAFGLLLCHCYRLAW